MKKTKSGILLITIVVCIIFSNFLVYAEDSNIPTRDEVDEKYKWKLEDIYLTDDLWEEDIAKLEEMIPNIQEYKEKISNSYSSLYECLNLWEEMSRLCEKLYVYASMRSDEDNANDKYKAMVDRIEGVQTDFNEATAYIDPEILTINEEKLREYLKNEELKEYDLYFEKLLKEKEHMLSESEERILALSGEMAVTAENVYEAFKYVDRKIGEIEGEDGEIIKVSPAAYSKLLENPNRYIRRKAFETEFSSYKDSINVLAATLSGEVKSNIFYAKVRNYDSALNRALEPDNIDTTVYDKLIEAVNNDLEPLHKYVSLRKKVLGIKNKVRYYDMYVSMVPEVSSNIDYEGAKEMVIEALAPLGSKYIEDLQKGFDSGWIDVYETQNKYSGAYSWGSYDTHPYVLLNYNGTLSSVSTIAHEMGHALNSLYSNENQPYIKADYPTFTAEVASTTNEALMYDYLIENAETKEEKMYLINDYLEQIRASIYTQIMYAEFEKAIHEEVENGEAINATFLNDTWGNLMAKYYGEDFEVDDLAKVWWAKIPHFYWNFYVYKYATGLSAGIILSDKIASGSDEARDAYLDFLAAGRSDYPVELLKSAGVDMSTTEPVEKALEKFDELLTELEMLMNN